MAEDNPIIEIRLWEDWEDQQNHRHTQCRRELSSRIHENSWVTIKISGQNLHLRLQTWHRKTTAPLLGTDLILQFSVVVRSLPNMGFAE